MCICKRRISNHKTQAADELRQMIKDFEQTQQSQGDAAEEVMDFAQDFAKEYLTYEKGGEQDFRTRINPYISQRLNNAPGIYAFGIMLKQHT